MTSEAPAVTQALEYSRMADPEAWANAESGKHSRENNIRLAQANAMGKARYLSELLAGFSQSQFVEAAASENGENLLNALVGVLSDYPNHRQSADSHHRLIEALREAERAIAEYYRYWTGGEARGSYDGKPERNGLWKAKHKARQTLASIEGTGHDNQ